MAKKVTISTALECSIERWQRLAREREEARKQHDNDTECENCGKRKIECECPELFAFDILSEMFPSR